MADFYLNYKGEKFTILQLTDTQIIDSSQRRYPERLIEKSIEEWDIKNIKKNLFDYMDKLVKITKPDLIIITGDVVYGEFDDKGSSLKLFIEKMESYKIPWAPVWGNHDNECILGVDYQCEQLNNAPHCLFKKGNTTGCSNYTIGIKNHSGQTERLIFMLDSNGCYFASDLSVKQGVKKSVGIDNNQLYYMEKTYDEEVSLCESQINSLCCFHIQPLEFIDAMIEKGYYNSDNFKPEIKALNNDFGSLGEKMDAFGFVPLSKSFSHCHVDGVFVGHSHINNLSLVDKNGIRWTYGVKTGTYDYHSKSKLGGTKIVLSKGNFKVEHIYL